MKVYLAAPYAGRDVIKGLAPLFTGNGHVITSGWLQASRAIAPEHLGTAPGHDDGEVMAHAGMDLREVDAAQVVVHFTANFLKKLAPHLDDVEHQLHSGGRHVETGYGLALHKSVIILGEPENIFQRGLCHLCPDLADALLLLGAMDELAETVPAEPPC